MKPPGKYRIGAFKPFVPDWLRFCILLLTALTFQLSGAVYLANLNEMVGSTGFTAEEVRMFADASFCGTTIMFPILFRLKFRFMSKTLLLTSGAVILVGNLMMMQSTSMPLLLATSFILGMFKIVGTFECMTSMQLVVTPKRDLAVFFSFLFLIVLSAIQLSGIVAVTLAERRDWHLMHLAVAGVLAVIMLLHASLLRPFRFIKKMPLYGIDWLGMALWSAVMVLLSFVCEYGRRLDWLDSALIRTALVAMLILTACAWFRMFTTKRPLFPPEVFGYKSLVSGLILHFAMQIMLAPGYVIIPAFTAGVLKYSALDSASLNWAMFVGVALGAAFSYHWLALHRGGFKPIILCGFLFLSLSCVLLNRLVAPSIPKESFYLPYALRGMGQAILFISLTVAMAAEVPFRLSMASVGLFGVIRTAIGGTIANVSCSQLLEHLYKAHRIFLGQEIDSVNPLATTLRQSVMMGSSAHGHTIEEANIAATSMLYGKVQLQAMLTSWKDLLAWWTLLGALFFVGIVAYRYMKPGARFFPSMRQFAADLNPSRQIKRQIQKMGRQLPVATTPAPSPELISATADRK